MRVFTRRPGSESADPMAVHPGATVVDVADAICTASWPGAVEERTYGAPRSGFPVSSSGATTPWTKTMSSR